MGLFKWVERVSSISVDCASLGAQTVALRVPHGFAIPDGCAGVAVAPSGHTRRIAEGARVSLADGEVAHCFHCGPYAMDVAPFAAAPEVGLRVIVAINTPDPRVPQQRFDLFLASEAGQRLELAQLAQLVAHAVQHELAQGNLELPPCTTPVEWTAFRASFNQLIYTRFGLTVDDCMPVDLGEQVDFGAMLLARAAPPAAPPQVWPAPRVPPAPVLNLATQDERAMRRLFLELPALMQGLRLSVLPAGQDQFRQQQLQLQRLDLLALAVGTMPSFGWAAPDQPLDAAGRARRARHSQRAAATLDEAWALLARFKLAAPCELPALFDDAERIVANLEHDCAQRRLP